jgi:hypothetical protein
MSNPAPLPGTWERDLKNRGAISWTLVSHAGGRLRALSIDIKGRALSTGDRKFLNIRWSESGSADEVRHAMCPGTSERLS